MRTALVLLALIASVAHADDYRPHLNVLYEFPGLDVVESINDYSHNKGDSGVKLDYVHVYMANRDGRPHIIRMKKLELLHGHCNSQTWTERTNLPIRGLALYGWDNSDLKASGKVRVVVPGVKDLWSVHAMFNAVHVYNECDRFAFGIAFEVDGRTKQIELEMQINRSDPK